MSEHNRQVGQYVKIHLKNKYVDKKVRISLPLYVLYLIFIYIFGNALP